MIQMSRQNGGYALTSPPLKILTSVSDFELVREAVKTIHIGVLPKEQHVANTN